MEKKTRGHDHQHHHNQLWLHKEISSDNGKKTETRIDPYHIQIQTAQPMISNMENSNLMCSSSDQETAINMESTSIFSNTASFLLRQDQNELFSSPSSYLFDSFPFYDNNSESFLRDFPLPQNLTCQAPATEAELSEVLNTTAPASPNASSVSSSSNEAGNDTNNSWKACGSSVTEEQKGTKQQLKAKKKNQKSPKEPRFAFLTKTDIDQLDDGYKWRKYGQKAVKNSPSPRSYYRCTTAGCGVKKRVERSSDDPSIVVTTYEGQHTHHFPITPRGHIPMLPSPATSSFLPLNPKYLLTEHQEQQQLMMQPNTTETNALAVNDIWFADHGGDGISMSPQCLSQG